MIWPKKMQPFFVLKKQIAVLSDVGQSPFLAPCKNNDYDGRICYTL